MTIAHFLRRGTPSRRVTHLAIVVLPNEATAFQVTRLLHYHGISPEHIAIVGEGYSSPDRVGLRRPVQIAASQAKGFAVNAAFLGCLLSLLATLIWQFEINWVLLALLTGTLSGIVGAIVGGAIGFLGEGNTASIYRHHLNQGRYLLMIEGPETLVAWSREILSQYSTSRP